MLDISVFYTETNYAIPQNIVVLPNTTQGEGAMKVRKIDRHDGFKPFTFEITIESEEELKEVWHRFNISSMRLMECPGYRRKRYEYFPDNDHAIRVVSLIGIEMEARDIKP
jgi:hypothetical protein